MPIIKFHMYKGRSHEAKEKVAKLLTDICIENFGSSPQHIHIIFDEFERENWFVGEKLKGASE